MFNQPLNPLFRRSDVILREVKELVESGQTVSMVLPFSFQMPDNSWWLLPFEPLVSIRGSNVIIKRNVAKSEGRGTIKSRWSEDDLKITIEGTFVNTDLTKYPATEVQKLRKVIAQRRSIGIQNELLQLFNVSQLAIEDFDIPFTKGENGQNYRLETLSDDSYNLFIEVK